MPHKTLELQLVAHTRSVRYVESGSSSGNRVRLTQGTHC